jgi:soluble lytic murein transglycosylase-like protein
MWRIFWVTIFLSLYCAVGTRSQAIEGICEDSLPAIEAESVIGEVCPDPLFDAICSSIEAKLTVYKRAPRMDREQIESVATAILWGWGEYGFPPSLILSMIETESSFNHHVISRHGAVGLMQVMPKYAKRSFVKLGLGGDSKKILLTPHLNVRVGIVMLYNFRVATKTVGHPLFNKAVMAYNCGEVPANRFYKNRSHYTKPVYVAKIWKRTPSYRELGVI